MEFYEGLIGTAVAFLIFGGVAGISARWPHPRRKDTLTAADRAKLNKDLETLESMAFFLFFLSLVSLVSGIWVGVATS